MKTKLFKSLMITCAMTAAGCSENHETNKPGLSLKTYQPSRVVVQPMIFPGGNTTIFKPRASFKDKKHPQPYEHKGVWAVYMAAPGWTNGGAPIVERLSSDSFAVWRVKQFIHENGLRDKVKVAWLQYDKNPNPEFIENLDLVPDNFIPLFLKPHGPEVDFYIYSPATRSNPSGDSLRYDHWLKPYLSFAKKIGSEYVATNNFHRDKGFNDANGKYWDSWARHWFIVNPDGMVVDAYFSNLGYHYIQGPDKPINSLIYHLKLESNSLVIPKIITSTYSSFYTEPYWDQVNTNIREIIGDGQQQ